MSTWGADGHEHEWEPFPKELQAKALVNMEKCKHCPETRRNPFLFEPMKPAE